MANGVRLVKLNWDDECKMDFYLGRGFEITQTAIYNRDQKSKYGIQSPIFCSDWADENAFEERYSCKCGNMRGKVFEGETCTDCKTTIEYRDVDLSITGWMIMKDHYIIQPIFYKKLVSIIGKEVFPEIIGYDKKVSRDGQLVSRDNKNQFAGIGLTEFKDRFDEIMGFYQKKFKKHPRKTGMINEILEERDKVFAKSIPVYSSVLRPLSFRGESFFFSKIDRKYNSIFSSIRLLNDNQRFEARRSKLNKKGERLEIPNVLSSLQEKLITLWDLIFEQIDQKDGHVKSDILGGMINFSSRCVIVPDPYLRADDVRLPYMAFLELYKYEIISCLVKISDVTENNAYEQWFRARIKFNPKIYEVMKFIIKKYKPKVIINRNPTINYGSLLCMNVVGINKDFEADYTMSLPIRILPPANADFDGDILNVISLKTKKLAKSYDKRFNPAKNMYVSRNDALFNSEMNLFKDQLVGLFEFCNI